MKLGQLVDDFWQGLAEPSFASWVGALLLCFAEFAACVVAFSEPRFARMPPEYLIEETAEDEYMQLSIRLNAMRLDRSELVQVAYVGASQATRGLDNLNPAVLSRQLSRRPASPPSSTSSARTTSASRSRSSSATSSPTTTAASSSWSSPTTRTTSGRRTCRSSTSSGSASRSTTPRPCGSSGASRATRSRADGRLLPRPPRLLRGPPRLGAAPIEGVEAQRQGRLHEEAGPPRAGPRAHRRADAAHQGIRREAAADVEERAVATCTRITENMSKRNVPVVFIENCQHPYRRELRPEYIAAWEEQMRAFSADHGAAYWNFNPDLDLTEDDFFDSVHVGSKTARQRYQKMLMDRLGELLRDQFRPRRQEDPHPGQGRRRAPRRGRRGTVAEASRRQSRRAGHAGVARRFT